MTRLTVVYYSSTGTVDAMARRCAATAEAQGAEVRLRQVYEAAPVHAIHADARWRAHVEATADEPPAGVEDVLWADAVMLGTPPRFGNLAGQLMQFLETLRPHWSQGLLADKVYAGFTSGQAARGQESTLLSLYTTIHHLGGVLVAPIHTEHGAAADGDALEALDHLTDRVLTVARALQEAA
ncbi:MAG TPA: NAD(P)H-dependent oxidoreductase [Mycobacteriales bacterium]|nr:NAD(P)H-dependent oxidoreductase [Mycobacteriales bacterium]